MSANSIVYFVSNGTAIKIGRSSSLPDRLKALTCGSSSPLEIICTIDGGSRHEQAIHRDLATYRLNGEWFQDCSAVRAAIEMYRRDGITPTKPRMKRKYKHPRVGELDNLKIDSALFEIDLYKLPMLQAKREATRQALLGMEAILAEIKLRMASGENISELVKRADYISNQIR